MTRKEKAICEVYTGIAFFNGDDREDVYKYASELLGRPILTHEFYTLSGTLKDLALNDFIDVCRGKYAEELIK